MKRHAMGSVLCLTLTAWGCYDSAFVRNDGPVSARGVKVSLVGQRCQFAPDPEAGPAGAGFPNRLDLGVRVAIENGTQDPLTVEPENLRLLVGTTWDAPVQWPKPLTLGPGATANIEVRFKRRGAAGCGSNLALGFPHALLDGGRPVELGPVGFVPGVDET